MLRDYVITVSVGSKTTKISDQIDTNYVEGEAYQLAELFYRAMLANGYTPSVSAHALVKAAANGGFGILHGGDDDQHGLDGSIEQQ